MNTPVHPDIGLPLSPDAPWLAPLAGYSDLPFRLLCREFGAAVCVTEMVSAKGLVYGSQGTEHLLATNEDDRPLVLQLYGFEERFVEAAMDMLLERGFTHFDLNAGCSVPKVVKTGAGAALMRDLDRLGWLLKIMSDKAGPGRVGVKFRLGWSMNDDTYLELADKAQENGAAWLTLHPRYARQLFRGDAEWSALANLQKHASVPVLASGDLYSAEDGARCLEETGVDGLMFARGALKNPRIFDELRALQQGGAPAPEAGPEELAALIRRHMDLSRRYGNEHVALLKMRTFVPRYVRNLPGVKALRMALCKCATWEDLEQVLQTRLLDSAAAEE